MRHAKTKVFGNDAAAYLLRVHAISAAAYRGREVRQFFELGWGVTLSRGKVDPEIRELNLIGRKRLTRRAAQWSILVWCDLWRFC